MYRPSPNAPFKPPRPMRAQTIDSGYVAEKITENTTAKRSASDSASVLKSREALENRVTPDDKLKINSSYKKVVPKDHAKKTVNPREIELLENREDGEEVGDGNDTVLPAEKHKEKFIPVKKVRLQHQIQAPKTESSSSKSSEDTQYVVQWRKRSTKKNKTWEGDGILIVANDQLIFKSDGKVMGKTKKPSKDINDTLISIGMYELEIDCKIEGGEPEVAPVSRPTVNSFSIVKSQYKPPIANRTPSVSNRKPLYTSNENSVVLMRPPNTPEERIVDVSIDPHLAKVLRPHQVDGVKFMYECVMGFRSFGGNGALLADEMGLGKTLMAITLIWTLYKQNPFIQDKSSIVKKVLICCPVTLIDNWNKEFKKWLGPNKMGILTVNSKQSSSKDKENIVSFGKYKIHQVLVIGYERLLTCTEELSTIDFDLLICDEAHKLKNSANKALKILNNLDVEKKVLLTGTPIQNDLAEFFTIVNFVNPGVLGTFQHFQKKFMRPILLSREVNCFDPEMKKTGNSLSQEMINITKDFILRRRSQILSSYLSSKSDVILFVPPTNLQLDLFKFVENSAKFNSLISENNSNSSLALITLFKKICNSPSLLTDDKLFCSLVEESNTKSIDLGSLARKVASGKINVLIPLLIEINRANEKVVLVSNYTQTLVLLEKILKKLNMTFVRLDGSTANNMRSKIVNDFNNNPTISVFLLSSKSGGMGLNLVGASRLILFDNDWNPSTDLQSMARIHRDGQKNPVFIYRMLTIGCMDEKIFQRQLVKNNLSKNILDNDLQSNSNLFDHEDLRNLFEIITDTNSSTHDLLLCDCKGDGTVPEVANSEESDGQDVSEDEHDVSSSQYKKGWISALDIKENDPIALTKKAMKNSLTNYQHYDITKNNIKIFPEDTIIDQVLSHSSNDLIKFLMFKHTDSENSVTD